jgi:L-ascorbate 6-phosphate lactonase
VQTGDALFSDFATHRPEHGALTSWWLGQMGYLVRTAEHLLCFDPYLAPNPSRQVPPLLEPAHLDGVDLIFGSHDHSDHIDREVMQSLALRQGHARVVCSRVAAGHVRRLGVPSERVVALDEGLRHTRPGLRITPIPAAHETFDRDPLLGYPYLAWVVESGGVTILHLGDTLCYDGLLARLRRWQFDIVFVPINGRDAERYTRGCIGNMTYQEAVDLCGQLGPRLAVPGHYDMFANNAADPQTFAAYMAAKYPQQSFWIGGHGEAVALPPEEGNT